MYSQNNEEKVILEYFKGRQGTFLDIGANDGETLSNTRALYLDGWQGVCVEPMGDAFSKLSKLYEGTVVQPIQIAISDYNGYSVFYESGSHLKKGDTGLLSTLSSTEILRWKGTEEFTESGTNVCDFQTFLGLSSYKKFNFISCDAEGVDYLIIKQINFDELGVEMLCVETNSVDNEKYDRLMETWGFILHYSNFENRIYVK